MKRVTTEDMRVLASTIVIGALCGLLPPNSGSLYSTAMTVLYVVAAITYREILAWLGARAFTWLANRKAGESR